MAVYGSTRYASYRSTKRKCAECGKKFSCPQDTVYRAGDNVFCSYTCYRKETKPVEDKMREDYINDCDRINEYMRQMALRNKKSYATKRVNECAAKASEYFQARRREKKGSPEYLQANKLYNHWYKKKLKSMERVKEIEREIRHRPGEV